MRDPEAAPPDLGAVVREQRRTLGLTLDQVSARSGISKSMLSQIERGMVNPTFSVVWNLTQALDLDIADLTGDGGGERRRVIDHMPAYSVPVRQSADGLCTLHLLSPKRTVLPIEWYEMRLAPGGELTSPAHARGTYEHLTCLDGALELTVGPTNLHLKAGETARYYADQPHTIGNGAEGASRALLLIALPAQYRGR